MVFGTPLFWRETNKPAKFLIFDGRVVLVLVLMIMHLRVWTVALAFIVMGIFWYFDRKGVPADAIMRYLRARIVGKKRSARGVQNERVAVDFYFEPKTYRRHMISEFYRSEAPPKKAGILASLGFGGKSEAKSEPSKQDSSLSLEKGK